jgi:hypothetical protein
VLTWEILSDSVLTKEKLKKSEWPACRHEGTNGMTGRHGSWLVVVDSFAEQKECQGKMVGVRTSNAEVHILQLRLNIVSCVTVHSLMTLAVDGHERSTLCLSRFNTAEGSVGPKAVQDAVVNRDIYKRACRKTIPSHPVCSPSLYWLFSLFYKVWVNDISLSIIYSHSHWFYNH